MAKKRMFDKEVLDTDRFMDLSLSSKALYFLLGMDADDEGFVSPRRVMRIHGGNDDDLKLLIAKNFVIPFKSGVVVITDWKQNNYLDKNKIAPTQYQEELKLLTENNRRYIEFNQSLTLFKPEFTQDRIGEDRIGEDRISPLQNEAVGDGGLMSEVFSTKTGNQINDFIRLFGSLNPSYQTLMKRRNQRESAERLIKQNSLEWWKEFFIGYSTLIITDRYCPKATTPQQLEDKLAGIIAYGRSRQNDKIDKKGKQIIS